ncbi:BTB/POZ domain-containing protein 3-like [Ruditapes philippinarum]|uniref:BTB/POZ domain-containing protein 3-like n=1 Tax=Ruditapes philippinarum TaxID=129788 RepID=UPI00295B231D|nr:BTB/POZ domain-containing protein 3-like [Ruditapes philippinarum]
MEVITTERPSTSEAVPDWQLNKNLGGCLIELYERNLWTDVKFCCKDHDEGETIHAHKIVLAARSPVFQQMFFGAFKQNKEEIDAEKRVFDLLLRYIYSDTVTLHEDTASDLLQLAHMYQIPTLVELCADYLQTILTPENACEILQLAIMYEIASLTEACCLVIDKNAISVLNSDRFMDLSKDALHMILKGDTFFANEEEIFLKVEEWAKQRLAEQKMQPSGNNVREYLGKSFYYLRVPTMSYQSMRRCIQDKDYFTQDEESKINDFISKVNTAVVTSNSSESRTSIYETLTWFTARAETEQYTSHSLNFDFDIDLKKSVKLISLSLCNIDVYIEYEHFLVGYQRQRIINSQKSLSDFFEEYNDEVIHLYNRSWNRRKFVQICTEKNEIDLEKSSYPAIHGKIHIPELNVTQTFQFNPLQTSHDVIIERPVILKKRVAPYRVKLSLKFNCCLQTNNLCNRHMQMQIFKMSENTNSMRDNIAVSPVRSTHGLLKSITFQIVSNRQ